MMFKTQFYCSISPGTLAEYFRVLVGKVFKILPIAEESKTSAKIYLNGLRFELQGVKRLFQVLCNDPAFISLLSILAELTHDIEDDECTIEVIKREVFQAISICQKLEERIMNNTLEDGGDNDE